VIKGKKKKVVGARDVAQWLSTCLVCARPWVLSYHQRKKKVIEEVRRVIIVVFIKNFRGCFWLTKNKEKAFGLNL
jgi:hypothetical protein